MTNTTSRDLHSAKAAKLADFVLLACVAASGLVSFYFFYHYSWIKDRQFTNFVDAVLYGLPPVAAGSLLLSLKARPRYRISLALTCLSCIALVYGAELYLVFSVPAPPGPLQTLLATLEDSNDKEKEVAKLSKRFNVEIDARSTSEVIRDLRKQGVKAVPVATTPQSFLANQPDGTLKSNLNIHGKEFVPLAGMSGVLNVLCNENGYPVIYKSDEFGFHNPAGLWNPGHIDIAALGHSNTHGFCVPSDRNYIGLIRERYPATLNLAISGHSPLSMLATLKEYLTDYRPKIVLWCHEDDDLFFLANERKSQLLMLYSRTNFSQGLTARQRLIDQALSGKVESMEQFNREQRALNRRGMNQLKTFAVEVGKASLLRQELGLVHADESADDVQETTFDLFCDVLTQANNLTRAWGGTLYFVYSPTGARYAPRIPAGSSPPANYFVYGPTGARYGPLPTETKIERMRVLNFAKTLGIPIIDVLPAFDAQSDPLSLFPFREFGHYTEAGHQLVASEILNALSAVATRRKVDPQEEKTHFVSQGRNVPSRF